MQVIGMKRVIGGVTYNTSTATALARLDQQDRTQTLYQTSGGAYFLDRATTHYRYEQYQDRLVTVPQPAAHTFQPMAAEEAREWLLKSGAEVFHNPFADPPEAAAAEEGAATVFLRIPRALKARIEAAAKVQGQSLNIWAIRTFEWRLSHPVVETPMRSDLGRLMPARANELAEGTRGPDNAGLADRLLAIGRDCAARLGEEYRSIDHDALLYDDKGLPR
jgi:predicted HicB family RNase H-like nuclease